MVHTWTASGNIEYSSKLFIRWSRNTNSSFSFWWTYLATTCNRIYIMVQVGLHLQSTLNTARNRITQGSGIHKQLPFKVGGGVSPGSYNSYRIFWNGTSLDFSSSFNEYSKRIDSWNFRNSNFCISYLVVYTGTANSATTESYNGTSMDNCYNIYGNCNQEQLLAGRNGTSNTSASAFRRFYYCTFWSSNRRMELRCLFVQRGCLGERREFEYG
jgi:hypothetical protein